MSRNNDIWQRKPAGLVLGLDFSGGRVTSPTGHTGTLVGNAAVAAGTRYLALDGAGDYLQVADAPEFSFTAAGQDQPWSFSAWVYLSALTARQYLAIKGSEFQITIGHAAAPSQKGLTVVLYNSAFTAYIGRTQNSAASIPTGQWFHVGSSYSGSEVNTGIILYQGGAVSSSTGFSGGSYTGISNTAATVDFGSGGPAQDASNLADIRLYNRVLTATEIAQIYNAGAARIAQGGTP